MRLWNTGYKVRPAGEVWVCWEAFHPSVRRFPGVVIPGPAQPTEIGDFVLALAAGGRFADLPSAREALVRLLVRRSPGTGAALDTGRAR